MKYLLKYMKKRKGMLTATLLLLAGQVTGTLLIPRMIAMIVDAGILKGDMSAIYRVGGGMLLVSLVTALISILGSYYSSELANGFGRDMRESIFRKSQEISLEQFERIGVSSMMTRSTSDISNLQQTLIMIIQLIIPAPFIVVVCMWMTLQISPSLAVIPAVCIVFFMIMAVLVLKKSQPLSKQIQVRMDKINQVVRERITGIRVIRAFDKGIYEQQRTNDVFEAYASHLIRLNRLFAVLNPLVWLIMGLSMAAIVWQGGLLAVGGTMQLGEITAVTEYTIITLSYLILAVMSSVTLPKMWACLQRLTEVLDMVPEIKDGTGEKTDRRQTAGKTAGKTTVLKETVVEFSNVTFSYAGAEEPVLRDLSFRCRRGETTAIIGSTGSGKSTIANLLLRLHEIDSGQILVQGKDIREMTQESLRNQIGYTPQKAILFSGTIAENLSMGKMDATKADIEKALTIAQADTFVGNLPLGVNSRVSQNGSNFSGGQKQRLAIARAVIGNAPILVFDDSFSALDVKTEAALRKALKKYTAHAAKIVIAQRVQTISNADQIIVLDEGRIAGIGKHEDLLEQCDVYRAIAQSQLSPEEVSVS